MRDRIERNPIRSSFLNFLSRRWQGLKEGVSTLWQRLIGRAAPAEELLIRRETPVLNLQIESFGRLLFETQRIEQQSITLQYTNPISFFSHLDTTILADIYNRDFNSRLYFNFNQQWGNFDFNWDEPFYGHEQSTAGAGDQQWWRGQNPLAALPDPEDFSNSSKLAGNPNLEIPDDFICAITCQIMTDPVYDPNFNFPQQRYDRHAIERWLIDHTTNPYTRAPLTVENLVADHDLKARIDAFVANVLDTSVALIP